MAEPEVSAFLTHLAVERNVAASTRNQAPAALLFLYAAVLEKPLNQLQVVRANRPKRVLGALEGTHRLAALLLYGSGLRLSECLRLRVKDIEWELNRIVVRGGKGDKDWRTMLPQTCRNLLEEHPAGVKQLHEEDLACGRGAVYLPKAFARKNPAAPTAWVWQYVSPAYRVSPDPRSGERRRHHPHESGLNRVPAAAAVRAGVKKRVTSHSFRHSFATHLIESGKDIRTVQELLGHASVETTMIYAHVLNEGGRGVPSPPDEL